jgi:hypothetical protein
MRNGFERVGDIPIPDKLIVCSYAAPNATSEAGKEVLHPYKLFTVEFLKTRRGKLIK